MKSTFKSYRNIVSFGFGWVYKKRRYLLLVFSFYKWNFELEFGESDV